MTLIERIYYGKLDEVNHSLSDECDPFTEKEESEAYENVQKALTQEQFKLFDKFTDCVVATLGEHEKQAFIRGFKIGIRLICETFDLKFDEE